MNAGAISRSCTRVGLISDTHGVLDPRALAVFAEQGPLAAIVHAGDIGPRPDLLWELEALGPVTAVRGNCDHTLPGFDLGALARVTVAGARILVVHDFSDLGPIPADVDVVVCGHSHVPRVEYHGSVLVVNPGSASQRRRMGSRSVGILRIAEGELPAASIHALDEAG